MDKVVTSVDKTTPDSPDYGRDTDLIEKAPNIEYRALYDLFNVDNDKDTRANTALAKIWEYAKAKAPNKDKESIKWEVIRMKHRMGSPTIGEKPWAKLEMYAEVHKQMVNAEKRLQELETLS